MVVDKEDNELLGLEVIHHYVEMLDKYFGNVCELDIIFNFHKVTLTNSYNKKLRFLLNFLTIYFRHIIY